MGSVCCRLPCWTRPGVSGSVRGRTEQHDGRHEVHRAEQQHGRREVGESADQERLRPDAKSHLITGCQWLSPPSASGACCYSRDSMQKNSKIYKARHTAGAMGTSQDSMRWSATSAALGRTPANLRRGHMPPQRCKGAQGRGAHGRGVVSSTDTIASLRKHAHAPWSYPCAAAACVPPGRPECVEDGDARRARVAMQEGGRPGEDGACRCSGRVRVQHAVREACQGLLPDWMQMPSSLRGSIFT